MLSPKITLSGPISDGSPQELVEAGNFTVQIVCPVCKNIFLRGRARARAQVRAKRKQFCSRSCRTRGLFLDRPDLREKMAGVMRRIVLTPTFRPWNEGLHWSLEHRAAVSKAAKAAGRKPILQGGNGRGMSPTEALIAPLLPSNFIWNCVVRLGKQEPGFPSNYKLDFGDATQMIGLEVDGPSHTSTLGQLRDAKKTKKLESLGWRLFRIKNTVAWSLYSTSKLRAHLHTLLGVSCVTTVRG